MEKGSVSPILMPSPHLSVIFGSLNDALGCLFWIPSNGKIVCLESRLLGQGFCLPRIVFDGCPRVDHLDQGSGKHAQLEMFLEDHCRSHNICLTTSNLETLSRLRHPFHVVGRAKHLM